MRKLDKINVGQSPNDNTGTSNTNRGNIVQIDNKGNLELGHKELAKDTSLTLHSPSGIKFMIKVSDDGTITATQVG